MFPRPEISKGANSGGEKVKIGIIAYGTSHWGVIESRDQLKNEYGIETDYLRLRAYPFTREVHEFIEQHDRVYVVEQNRDAQMLSLLKLDLKPELITRLRSIATSRRVTAGRALRHRRTKHYGGKVNGDHTCRTQSSEPKTNRIGLTVARVQRR